VQREPAAALLSKKEKTPRAQPRGGAAAAEDEDDQEELANDEEKGELGEQSPVISSYTTESGLSCLNVYRPGSKRLRNRRFYRPSWYKKYIK
jgi:hypothetical protein